MQIKTNKLWYIFNKKKQNEFVALKDVSLVFNKGEFVSIIGHSGSGKTTLIEHLNGLIKPSLGRVEVDGDIITNSRRKIKNIKEIRRKVGIVFQFAEYQLFEDSIEKDIIFGPISLGIPKKEAKQLAKKYIKVVGLPENYLERSPFSLSGGQKRRVALAGILSMEPDFLILDEPTAGLDPQGEKEIYEIFKKLNENGTGVIVVTHNLNHVLEYSTRTIVLKNGSVIRDDDTLKVMYDWDFLINNELFPSQITHFIYDMNARGYNIQHNIRNIEELSTNIRNHFLALKESQNKKTEEKNGEVKNG